MAVSRCARAATVASDAVKAFSSKSGVGASRRPLPGGRRARIGSIPARLLPVFRW
jgi:hypothetical protein